MGPTTTFVKVVSILLVAMLSLASGRSLVPGLCATQAALDDGSVPAECCDDSSRHSTDGPSGIQAQGEVACAFCNLATTLVTSTVSIDIVTSAAPAPAEHIVAAAFIRAEAIDRTHAGRAPPVSSAA